MTDTPTGTVPKAITQAESLDDKVAPFVEAYEFRHDDGGAYTPNDADRAMLEDAIHGFIAEHVPANAHRRLASQDAGEGMLWSEPLKLGSDTWERPAWLPADALLKHESGREGRASSWAFGPTSVFSVALVRTPPSDAGSTTREAGEGVVAEALAPFVRHWQPWMDATDASDDGSYNYSDDEPMSCFARVTYGDLRRARAALTPPSDAGSTTRSGGEGVPKLKPGYPDYVDDPDGLDRFRDQVRRDSGHDMADCNNNSLGRLIDTIERLRRERDAALATTPSPDASPDSGEAEDTAIALLDEVHRALSTKGIHGRHFALNAIRAALAASPASLSGGAEARDPHRVNLSDLIAAITNDAAMFDRLATNMFECWHGTGTSMEEGSASNDYRVWGNEAHNRSRHLKALLRDAAWQRDAALAPSPEAPANRQEAGEVEDAQAAAELVEWWDTGILRDGLVREEAAELLASGKSDEHSSVRRAEHEITSRIVRRAARRALPTPSQEASNVG